MLRAVTLASIALSFASCSITVAAPLSGNYIEARTCQVYTGPCFANGEVGLAGKDAIMSWRINQGTLSGIDLAGLSVAVIVKSSDTLGFHGLNDARSLQAIVIVDAAASPSQATSLSKFAISQTGLSEEDVVAVHRADIELQLDRADLTAQLEIPDYARLVTRKARPGDCICSNESAYYPPLAKLKGFVPGVTIEGDIAARRLGSRWSIPDSRTAYMGTFEVDGEQVHASLAYAQNK